MAIFHELSWSSSRARTFGECKRMYYYQYYGGWRGWERDEPEERQRIYRLSKLTRMYLETGSIVHSCVARYFHSKKLERVLDSEELAETGADMLREKFRESVQGRWRQRPAKFTHFAEHHFEESTVSDRASAAEYGGRHVERIRESIRGFFETPDLAWVREAAPETYVHVEEEDSFDTFDFEGTKVFGIPDFAIQDGRGLVHLYDWKTGKPDEDNDPFQLHVYALYADTEWEIPRERFRAYDAYLGTRKVQPCEISEKSLDEARARIRASIEAMRELHFNADEGMGSAAPFPQIPADSPAAVECKSCRFRELCDR